jgi:hypothetical protein
MKPLTLKFRFLTWIAPFIVFATTVISCKKEDAATLAAATPVKAQNQAAAAAGSLQAEVINSTWSVNWNNYTDGTYTLANATTDFGNISVWVPARSLTVKGSLCLELLKNTLSESGGLVSNIDISNGSAYKLDYWVKFHPQFDWSRGGKVGFGFLVGNGNTGGNPAWDGNGGSLRLIWYTVNPGRVVFRPYAYYNDQPNQTGDDFGVSYPASGSLVKGQWYQVHMYIKSNTGSNTDGHVQVTINGTILLDQDIRWTTNNSKRLINTLTLHTFRGGDDATWESPSNGYIYFDNLRVQKVSN